MVEMAMVLPVLLLLALGVIEFGWYVFNYSSIENATRRGTEQAAKEPPLPVNAASPSDGCVLEIKREAKRTIGLIEIPDSAITVVYAAPAEGRQLGSHIQVRVQYTGQFLTPLADLFGSGDFRLDFRSQRSILDTMVFQQPQRCP
jgi:hypothetical protein